jgi:hypothetical protein
MSWPELLADGVVLPLPYPLPYLPLVVVLEAVVLEVSVDAAVDPVVVVLPHAASRTRAIYASSEHQARVGADEEVKCLCIVLSFVQSS